MSHIWFFLIDVEFYFFSQAQQAAAEKLASDLSVIQKSAVTNKNTAKVADKKSAVVTAAPVVIFIFFYFYSTSILYSV